MKYGIGSIGGSWILAVLLVMDNVTLPDEIKWLGEFAPLLVIAIGHGYGGHRIAKKKK